MAYYITLSKKVGGRVPHQIAPIIDLVLADITCLRM